MPQLLPSKDKLQEEHLQPMFERSKQYLDSKRKGLKNVLHQVAKTSSWERIQNFFYRHWYQMSLGVGTVAFASLMIFALVLSYLPGTPVSIKPVNVAAAELSLDADKKDALGVAGDSRYTLKSTQDLTLDQVRQGLMVEPKFDFKITQISPREFKIEPVSQLDPKTIYKFKMKSQTKDETKDLSWAFQVKEGFKVLQTLPRDKTTQVPLDSGIEINFNTPEYADPNDLFSITPQVEGTFERSGRTFIFKPKALQPKTVYTVKLKAGLRVKNSEETLNQDTIFQFETRSKEDSYTMFGLGRDFAEFNTSTKPALRIYAPEETKTANFTLYSYSDIAAFATDLSKKQSYPFWALYYENSTLADTSRLTKAGQYQLDIRQSNYDRFVELPSVLEPGFYILEAKSGDNVSQSMLQVTDISGYMQESNNKTLVWVNDTKTGGPVGGASITVTNTALSYKTNEQGVAVFENTLDERDNDKAYVVESNGRQLLIPRQNQLYCGCGGAMLGDVDYWTYTYTDRPVYQTSDTVSLYGFVQNRSGAATDDLKAVMTKRDFSQDGAPVDILSQKLELKAGAFATRLDYKNLEPGVYEIAIQKDDKILSTVTFRVEEYVKPAYKLELTSDKKAYDYNEVVKLSGRAVTYDGAPLPGLMVQYRRRQENIQVKADQYGRFQFDIAAADLATLGEFTGAYIATVEVNPANSEEAEISGQTQVTIFYYQIAFSVEAKQDNDKTTVSGRLNQIDKGKIERGENTDGEDFLGAPVSGRDIVLNVREFTYDKIENGEYYDFINKKTVKKYSFQERQTNSRDISLTTGGDGRFSTNIDTKPDHFYRIAAYTAAVPANTLTSRVKAETTIWSPNATGGNTSYSLVNLSGNYNIKYNIGDKVALQYTQGGKQVNPGPNGKFLTSINSNGLQDYTVNNDPNPNLEFSGRMVPSAWVNGVYFDGKYYHDMGGQSLEFNPESRRLKMEVKPDKDTYKPGEEVKLQVKVTDQNGKPVQTVANLSVVDEALFDVEDQFLNPLEALYRGVGSGIRHSYFSHDMLAVFERGGMGGSGGDRSTFVDTAYFTNVQTDAQGQATTSFTLPDNLTDWRVTYQTISPDLQVGYGRTNFKTSIALAGAMNLNPTYLTGDKPVVKARAISKELSAGTPVKFALTSDTLSLNKTLDGRVGEDVEFALDALPQGQHKIKLQVVSGEKQDSLERSIIVSDAQAMGRSSKTVDFNSMADLPQITGPVDVAFSDQGRNKMYNTLLEQSYTYGDRLDQQLSRKIANQLLAQYFREQTGSASFQSYADYQTESGGLTILPYSDQDIDLSTQVALLSPDSIDKGSLKKYFYKIVNGSEEARDRKIQSLLGLAALGEPVLPELDAVTQNITNLAPQEKLYLALAQAVSGNTEIARKMYFELVKGNTTTEGQTKSLNVPSYVDGELANVAMAGLGAMLQEKTASEYYEYSQAHRSSTNVLSLWKLMYIRSWLPNLDQSAVSFSYNLDGQTQEVTLDKGQSKAVRVDGEKLKDLDIKVKNGKLGLTLVQKQPLSQLVGKSQSLNLTRTYKVNGKATTEFSDGQLVEVELKYDLGVNPQDMCYAITDYLPAGLKPSSWKRYDQLPDGQRADYAYQVSGQTSSFCVGKWDKDQTVRYFARVSGKGEYKAEPAVIQAFGNTSSFSFSETQSVSVK